MENLNNGHVLEITPDMFEQAANDFSEGNEILKELLTFCFENGIKTRACCSGHNGEKRPYIAFEFNEQNMDAILKMLKQLSLGNVIDHLSFNKEPNRVSMFSISMQDDKYNEGFQEILDSLKSEKEVALEDLDPTRQLIVKSLQNHSVPDSYLEIQEDQENIYIAADPKDYFPFSRGDKLEPWMDGSIIAEYPKDSNEGNQTLKKLENQTKNRKYLSEHPYNNEKVSELFRNRELQESTMEMSAEATLERKYEYGDKNKTVMVARILPGSSIEDFAVEAMKYHQYGQAFITKFNSFEIDTRDYNSPEEIVKAYEEYCNKERESPEAIERARKLEEQKLKAQSKTQEYFEKHPYNRDKIDELWKNRDEEKSTIIIDHLGTREMRVEYEYGLQKMVCVDAKPDSTIEDFANEVMEFHQYGQAFFAGFNSFRIDTRDYNSPEEIVKAYEQYMDKDKTGNEGKNGGKTEVTLEDVREAETQQGVKNSDVKKEIDAIETQIIESQKGRETEEQMEEK